MRDDDELDPDEANPLPLSSVSLYRSALFNLYKVAKVPVPEEASLVVKSVLDSYERTMNKLKQRGLAPLTEGKRELQFGGYCMLSSHFMKKDPAARHVGGSWATTTFVWTFFVLCWNLMSRSDLVQSLMLSHIESRGDCIVIQEQGHKGDVSGRKKFWKHVYANPLKPEICPILALVMLVFSSAPRAAGERHKLFVGNNNTNRCSKILAHTLSVLEEADLRVLGCSPKDLGLHSWRKGPGTYVQGQVWGPGVISVQLRMGHSLGKVNDVYFFASDGADQLCGRFASGLPFTAVEFGTLPPHFKREVLSGLTIEFWREILDGYDHFPAGLKDCFPFLLASLIYHEDFLRAELPSSHPLWNCRVFSANQHLTELRSGVVTGIGLCPHTGMTATGVPPHLVAALNIRDLSMRVDQLTQMQQELSERVFDRLPHEIAVKVTEEIRRNFNVEGVQQLTLRDLDGKFVEWEQRIRELLVEHSTAGTAAPAVIAAAPGDQPQTWWRSWDWQDGRIMHYIPREWSWPANITVKKMWDLWYFGNRDTGVRPYSHIPWHDVASTLRMTYNRARTTVAYLEIQILTANPSLLPEGCTHIRDFDHPTSDRLFAHVYSILLDTLYDHVTVSMPRKEQITYCTLYNLLWRTGILRQAGLIKERKRKA